MTGACATADAVLLRKALAEVLACPVCKGTLEEGDTAALRCSACGERYDTEDGILLMIPEQLRGTLQRPEQQSRDEVASAFVADGEVEQILNRISRHHCIPVMRERARKFRAGFEPGEWILDVGGGWGWTWTGSPGAGIILLDFSRQSLRVARRLLGEPERVVLVWGDAACLPIKSRSVSGVWSVQATQHFPLSVFARFLAELDRVLLEHFAIEVHNLNPAVLLRGAYRLANRRFVRHATIDGTELRCENGPESRARWAPLLRPAVATIGYSELFFHPQFGLRWQKYPLKLERLLGNLLPGVAALFARQIQVRVCPPLHASCSESATS